MGVGIEIIDRRRVGMLGITALWLLSEKRGQIELTSHEDDDFGPVVIAYADTEEALKYIMAVLYDAFEQSETVGKVRALGT